MLESTSASVEQTTYSQIYTLKDLILTYNKCLNGNM